MRRFWSDLRDAVSVGWHLWKILRRCDEPFTWTHGLVVAGDDREQLEAAIVYIKAAEDAACLGGEI